MIIYNTRYQAKKNATSEEKVVKVDGGYTIMSYDEYRRWKGQK